MSLNASNILNSLEILLEKERDENNWPVLFVFPIENLHQKVRDKLENKLLLEKTDINQLVRVIYNKMISYDM